MKIVEHEWAWCYLCKKQHEFKVTEGRSQTWRLRAWCPTLDMYVYSKEALLPHCCENYPPKDIELKIDAPSSNGISKKLY